MTLLRLPDNTTTQGPQLVQSALVSDPEVSQQIGLLSRNGQSTVEYGNLLTLPVAGGLLFVEPVYIERANQESSYPQLARVLAFYEGRVGFAATLAGALDQVLPGASAVVPTTPGQQPTPAQAGTPAPAGPPGATAPQVAAAASAIQQAIADLRAANQSGDFAAQGRALAALDAAVQQFQQANGQTPDSGARSGSWGLSGPAVICRARIRRAKSPSEAGRSVVNLSGALVVLRTWQGKAPSRWSSRAARPVSRPDPEVSIRLLRNLLDQQWRHLPRQSRRASIGSKARYAS